MCECGHELNAFGMHLTHCPFGGWWIATHATIKDVMYALDKKNGDVAWIE
jgi:hypothetical protein